MGRGFTHKNEFENMTQFLADTTVLVEHLRQNPKAKSFLVENTPLISFVTRAELIQGSRNKTDLKTVKILCQSLEEIPLTEKITRQAIELMEKFYLANNLLFLDALIAATALEENLTLVTDNFKHFSFIPSLKLKNWKEITT